MKDETLRAKPTGTPPKSLRGVQKYSPAQILEAADFYAKEWAASPKWKKSKKNMIGFNWLIEYQQGESMAYIAWRYQTSKGNVRDGVTKSRGRVETYFKIKQLEEKTGRA